MNTQTVVYNIVKLKVMDMNRAGPVLRGKTLRNRAQDGLFLYFLAKSDYGA